MDVTDQHLITVNATNHHGYLINKLWEFIQNKHKTDMCILSNGQMIQAHQLILEVFTSQEQLGYAALHDNSRNLNKILEFMYTGEIRVQPEELDSLLHLATDLGFGMLVDALQAAKNNSYEISPENSEHENSHMIPSGLVDSDNHAVCDFMPPVLNVSMLEPGYNNCHVKQELLDQSIVDDFNLSDTQNIVALENGEGQFVDSLEIHEEVADIHKYGINADINACSSKVVAGKNESQAGASDGYSTVPTINGSISSCANSMSPSRYPQRKQTRTNNSECDSLLDPDWKESNPKIIYQEARSQQIPPLDFPVDLAESMMAYGSSISAPSHRRGRSTGGRPAKRYATMLNVGDHLPHEGPTRRRCTRCQEVHFIERRTKTVCTGCGVPLCKHCFEPYHKK